MKEKLNLPEDYFLEEDPHNPVLFLIR